MGDTVGHITGRNMVVGSIPGVCVEFACFHCVCVDSLQMPRLHPTVQKHEVKWKV